MIKYINEYNQKQQAKLRKMQKASLKLNQLPLESFVNFSKTLNTHQPDRNEEESLIDEILNNTDLNDETQFLNVPITVEEISKCIKKLKNSKAPGSDQILNEYIKYTKTPMLPLYAKLFNLILETGIIPEKWAEGMIKPIFKNKGDPMNPENYRAIAFVSCVGKLLTAVLNERLNMFLSENEILSENQAGFRKCYSTNDHIIVLQSLFEFLSKKISNDQELIQLDPT